MVAVARTGPVTRLLIANRGEIAVRIARTAAAMGIATVAVYSDEDALQPHVHAADEAVAIGGRSAADSYLRAGALLEAAALAGADALHPGYGFLSESAAFAQAVSDAGLTWVGPAPAAIAAMADKLHAKALARELEIPVLEPFDLEAGDLSDGDFPVLVKAAAGGGGRGMRVVREPAGLAAALAAAQREAVAAFGDGTVFVEPHLARPRHVEVQIVGDVGGTVVALGDRDCSVQRRHQKLIEEAPAPGLADGLRGALHRAAVRVGEAIGYSTAGTVEFLVDGERWWFLEANTRLQVEHPVTELAVTVGGRPLDLVREQLRLAMGEALGYGQDDVAVAGHAVEARVCAEDPGDGFRPAAGRLLVWEPGPGVRVDTGVAAGGTVSPHYDSLLAKLVAVAPSRDEAAAVLARALAQTVVAGVPTTAPLLAAALRSPAFIAGEVSTAFFDDHLDDLLAAVAPAAERRWWHAAATALSDAHHRHASAPVLSTLPVGWRNNPSQPTEAAYAHDGEEVVVRYRPLGPGRWEIGVGDEPPRDALLHGVGDLEVGGLRRRVRVEVRGELRVVRSVLGADVLVPVPRFAAAAAADAAPGALRAPTPGTVAAVRTKAGEVVAAGDVLVVLESMKMEHAVTAPRDGTVGEVAVEAGQQVTAGAVLVVLEEGEEEGQGEDGG